MRIRTLDLVFTFNSEKMDSRDGPSIRLFSRIIVFDDATELSIDGDFDISVP